MMMDTKLYFYCCCRSKNFVKLSTLNILMIINYFALDDGDKKKIENEELTVEAVQMVTAMIKEAGPTLSSKEIEIIAGK